MPEQNPSAPKRRLYPYGLIALLLLCLAGYIYTSIYRGSKTRELNRSIAGMGTDRSMFGLIDSSIRVLYLAENNFRLYVVTSEKGYFDTYRSNITRASNLLDSMFRLDSMRQKTPITSLLEEKEARNARFIELRKLADSLLTLSDAVDPGAGASELPDYRMSRVKTTTTSDTTTLSQQGKRKKLFGRIADAFKKDAGNTRKLNRTSSSTTKVDSSAQALAGRKQVQDISRHYQQLIALNNKLKNAELRMLTVNNLLIDKLQTQLADFKNRIVSLDDEHNRQTKSAMELAMGRMKYLSLWEYLFLTFIIGFIGYNIWRIYRNEGQLLVYSKSAEQNARSKNEFLANMSHEIRTPLNSIIGFSEQLNNTRLSGEQKVQAEAIRSSSNMLLAIVNDILDLSKYQTGITVLDNQPFSPHALIGDTIATLKIQAEKKGIALLHQTAMPEGVQLLGDTVRIRQVFFNIIGNAIKFTQKGSVTVHSETQSQKNGQVLFRVSISDTGPGIPANQLDHIFDKFVQVSGQDTDLQQKGTGLGLAIVKLIVEQYRGRVDVESEVGKGTTFSIQLPLEQAAAKAPVLTEDKPRKTGEGLSGKRILLADDNEMNILLVRTILKRWGVECDVATDGNEAFDKYSAKEYDLLITDIQMPRLSGEDLTRKIRAMNDPAKSRVPILGCTANVLPEENARYRQAGMTDILLKPFKEQELYDQIIANLPSISQA